MPEEASLDVVLKTLKRWRLEAKDPRNDGWVQQAYRDKIRVVFSESSKILSEIKKVN